MAFGRKVDYAVDGIFAEDGLHGFEVADVGPFEDVVGTLFHVAQVLQIAGIGQLVEADDPVIGVFFDEKAYYVAPDEACAARDQDIAFHASLAFVFIRCRQ